MNILLLQTLVAFCCVLWQLISCSTVASTSVFEFTGQDQHFLPPGTQAYVYMWGAGGGKGNSDNSPGGAGAYVEGLLSGLIPGHTYTVVVGEGAGLYGGGGAPGRLGTSCTPGAFGGGRSAISFAGEDIVTAGGGGGALRDHQGGAATSFSGGAIEPVSFQGCVGGVRSNNFAGTCGGGGNQTGGGRGGQTFGGEIANNGLQYAGANATCFTCIGLEVPTPTAGGGGGGGYWGGGAGCTAGGGGGGSSFINAAILSNFSNSQGATGGSPVGSTSPYFGTGYGSGLPGVASQNGRVVVELYALEPNTPSLTPTARPTSPCPSVAPSATPTVSPSAVPTSSPTAVPSTPFPSLSPTVVPTAVPSAVPTASPTAVPSTPFPSLSPTVVPTAVPSAVPTASPTAVPSTPFPSLSPTVVPTAVPSAVPTASPTAVPSTPFPSLSPTVVPTASPTVSPTMVPTAVPSTAAPTVVPTVQPSRVPTNSPTQIPTPAPSTFTPTLYFPTSSPTPLNPALFASLNLRTLWFTCGMLVFLGAAMACFVVIVRDSVCSDAEAGGYAMIRFTAADIFCSGFVTFVAATSGILMVVEDAPSSQLLIIVPRVLIAASSLLMYSCSGDCAVPTNGVKGWLLRLVVLVFSVVDPTCIRFLSFHATVTSERYIGFPTHTTFMSCTAQQFLNIVFGLLTAVVRLGGGADVNGIDKRGFAALSCAFWLCALTYVWLLYRRGDQAYEAMLKAKRVITDNSRGPNGRGSGGGGTSGDDRVPFKPIVVNGMRVETPGSTRVGSGGGSGNNGLVNRIPVNPYDADDDGRGVEERQVADAVPSQGSAKGSGRSFSTLLFKRPSNRSGSRGNDDGDDSSSDSDNGNSTPEVRIKKKPIHSFHLEIDI